MAEVIRASETGALERAVEVLRAGGLVAFPTDTVYGVAAHGFLPQAVERLYQVKQRPADRPIPLLLADLGDMEQVVSCVPEVARELARLFWPGPLSLVLPRHPHVPDVVVAGGDSVAIRIPDHPVPQRLARMLQAPLAATSANRSGGPDTVVAQEVLKQIGEAIDLIVDGGACPGGVPSTVLDLTTDPPRLLRKGPITRAMLAEVLPEVQVVEHERGQV